jgi:hypothetical protein
VYVPTTWPPHSPDIIPLDFIFWAYIKDAMYMPPMATTLPELAEKITAAAASYL